MSLPSSGVVAFLLDEGAINWMCISMEITFITDILFESLTKTRMKVSHLRSWNQLLFWY